MFLDSKANFSDEYMNVVFASSNMVQIKIPRKSSKNEGAGELIF